MASSLYRDASVGTFLVGAPWPAGPQPRDGLQRARPGWSASSTSMLGLRAGSGLTVGVLGALIGVQWSLTFSSAAVVLVALVLLVIEARARPRLSV
jgi:hypothetical protein